MTSDNWYQGCNPINAIIKIRDITTATRLDSDILKGSMETVGAHSLPCLSYVLLFLNPDVWVRTCGG